MSELFYVNPSEQAALKDGIAILTDAEAKHLTRVMRKKIGDEAAVFDGSGREFRCVIEAIQRDRVELRVLETLEEDREPELALTTVVALPKGERQKWAIEKLTELGVRRFIPLNAERSDVKCDKDACERLRRWSLEASKQCRRLRLMEILPPINSSDLHDLVERLERRLKSPNESSASSQDEQGNALFHEFRQGDDVLRIVAHPISDGDFGQTSFLQLVHAHSRIPQGAVVLIGPVGGFTQKEVADAVGDGWAPLDLGKQVYRVETAAIVAASLLLHLN